MNLKVVETSLNLRIERGHSRMDYTLSKEVAEKQLEFEADVYTNVEYMECNNEKYLNMFKDAGYNCFSAVDEPRHRGIMCAVKSCYKVEEVSSMQDPHMLHLRITKGDEFFDLITVRILVAGSDDSDFMDRSYQWQEVMDYIDKLQDKGRIVITGDWNHGVISDYYRRDQARRFFNYQMIVQELVKRGIELYEIEGTSYRNYMKIDHIASGKNIMILNASYCDVFKEQYTIGIPDHKLIVAELECA